MDTFTAYLDTDDHAAEVILVALKSGLQAQLDQDDRSGSFVLLTGTHDAHADFASETGLELDDDIISAGPVYVTD